MIHIAFIGMIVFYKAWSYGLHAKLNIFKLFYILKKYIFIIFIFYRHIKDFM